MKPVALSLLALLTLLLFASCHGESSPTDPWGRFQNTLTGTVVDKYGNIWGGVTVSLSNEGGLSSTLTDMQGRYLLRGMPPGRYRLIVRLGRLAFNDAVNTEIELHEGENVYDIVTP